MDGIIGLIIIISFIIKLIDGDKKKGSKKQNKQSDQQWQQMVLDFKDKVEDYANQHSGKVTSNRQSTSYRYENRSYTGGSATKRSSTRRANDAYYYEQQQKATKDRLRQKYGSQVSNSYAKKAEQTDIVTRAKQNVQEEVSSVFKQETHAEVCNEYRSHVETTPNLAAHIGYSPECAVEGESDILKRVNDLIVMGYDGDMKFERDFIAEGVEMLNGFSL